MKIRYGKKNDAELLADIGAETFWDAYHNDSHLELKHLKKHIAFTFTKKKLLSELLQKKTIYLIAENEKESIGYIRLLPKNSRDQITGNKAIEISRIYLRKKFWGKRLGEELLKRCLKEAKKQTCDVVWLSVWKYNERAIKFYKKFGFQIVGEHIFDLAGDSQIDYLMQKDFNF